MRQQRAAALLEEQVAALRTAVESEAASLAAAAAGQGYEASEDVQLTRSSSDVDIALLRAVFDTPRSAAGQSRLSSASADNGDRLVFVLEQVEAASADQFFQNEAMFGQQLQGVAGQQDLIAFMQELRQRGEVVELR